MWNPGFAKLTLTRSADHASTGAATGAGGDADNDEDDDDDEDDEDDDAGAEGGVTAGGVRERFLGGIEIDEEFRAIFRARSKLKGS